MSYDLVTFYTSGNSASSNTAVLNCSRTGDLVGSINSIYTDNSWLSDWSEWFNKWLYPYPTITYPQYHYHYEYKQVTPDGENSKNFPPMNIVMDKASRFIEIKMAMAGYKKEDIEIEARDNHIVVSAKLTKDEPYKREDVIYTKENLKAESFTRKFTFPDEAYDFRNPKVTYVDGMLTLWIKRNPELTAKDKKIAIE